MGRIRRVEYKILRALVLWAIVSCCFNAVLASNGFYTPITSIQGLSQNEVRCMIQDKKGYLWIGTQDGLNQYDGYEFQKYSRIPFEKNSLSSDFVNVLMEDENERLWIGTIDGLDVLDKSRSSFINLTPFVKPQKSSTNVTSIVQVTKDDYLVSTVTQLNMVSETNGVFASRIINLPDKDLRLYKAVKDGKNNVWFATNKGLYYYNLTSKGWKKVEKSNAERVLDLSIDKANNIWFISNSVLYKYDLTMDKVSSLNTGLKTSAVYSDKLGDLWLGTIGQGVYGISTNLPMLDLKSVHQKMGGHVSMSDITIRVIYEGKGKDEDIIWLGTAAQGLMQYSRAKNSFINLHEIIKSERPEVSSYYSIYKDQDHLYAGTDNGLYTLDLKTNGVNKVIVDKNNLNVREHQDILKDRNDNLWLGTNNGLYIKKKLSNSFQRCNVPSLPKNEFTVFKLKEDAAGVMWVGTSKGLIKMTEHSAELMDSLSINGTKDKLGNVGALDVDKNGRLWVGTTTGLYCIDGDKKITKTSYSAKNKNGLIENIVNDVYASRSGDVWIASPKGLSKIIFGKEGSITFEHFTEKDGLFNTYIYGITEDNKGHLWLSSNKGLFDFDPRRKVFKWYGATDGLLNEEFNSGAFYKDEGGAMYFGGINLLVQFEPDKIIPNKHLANVQIREVKIDDKVISAAGGMVTVKYTANVVSIKLAALDFTNPQKNQYAYRINGLSADWVHLGNQRIINLFNLPYGNNVLEVKASNNEGVWSDAAFAQLTIRVEPPFWRKWWFYAMILGLLSFVIYAIHKARLNAKLAMERVRLEENERVRKMASQDLHDDFGNSLTRITILTEMIQSKLSQQKMDEASDLLDKIADNANRLYQGTKDFIWSIRADSENLFEAIVRIKDYAEDALAMGEISFNESGISSELKKYNLPPASSRHIVMIMKEAIMNTLKHSAATNAQLDVNVMQAVLNLSWKDNGQGMSAIEDGSKGNGLENMKSRAATIGAKIDVLSDAANGTTILLTIPLTVK